MKTETQVPKQLRRVAPLLSYELANDLRNLMHRLYNGLPVNPDDFDGCMAGAILEELDIAIAANPLSRLKHVAKIRKQQNAYTQ